MILTKRILAALAAFIWLSVAASSAVTVDRGVCTTADKGGTGPCTGQVLIDSSTQEIGTLYNLSAQVLGSVAGANTITASTTPALTSYVDGQLFQLKPAANNIAGAVTLNINSIAAKAVVSAAGAVLAAGDLQSSTIYIIRYYQAGDNFRIITSPPVAAVASAAIISVRQTVAGGPVTSGAPSFLPASAASLTLTAQNVTSGTPLVVTAAQGTNLSGPLNTTTALSSNPVWTGLTGSTTNYLYVNASTGATGFTTLVPVYQFGGTPSITNNQFTFNIGEMTGYMGNGTTAPATPLVFVGEAVTGASTITSTVAYSYNGFYDSGFTATLPAGSTAVSKPSNLGVLPASVMMVGECTTADAGFSVGDQLYGWGIANGTYVQPLNLWASRNAAGFYTFSGISAYGKSSSAGITAANWKWKVISKRSW